MPVAPLQAPRACVGDRAEAVADIRPEDWGWRDCYIADQEAADCDAVDRSRVHPMATSPYVVANFDLQTAELGAPTARLFRTTARDRQPFVCAIGFAFAALLASPAFASELVYAPVNPSFGGNPFNSAHLLGTANAQSKYKDPDAVDTSDPAQQFLRTLQSRLLSALSTQVTDIIFGENAQNSGLIKFGDQEISFVRGLESVILTITNTADGSVTEIVVPLLQGGTVSPVIPGR